MAPVLGGTQGLSMVLAIDTSGSMQDTPLQDAKQSAITYIDRMGDFDQAAVIGFDDEARMVKPFTQDKSMLSDAINFLKSGGRYTVLNDAIYDSISAAAQLPSGRKAVVVLSDGKDENSKLTLDDCIQY